MITTQINKYKSPYTPSVWDGSYSHRQTKRVEPMNKLEFAKMLGELEIKKGDLVVYKTLTPPYYGSSVHMVTDITEVHHLVNNWGFNSEDGPDIYVFMGPDGSRKSWLGSAFKYKVVNPDQYPKEWRDYFAAKANQQVSDSNPSGS